MIDLAAALAAGTSAAAVLKGLGTLESFFQRRNGKNGNGFTQSDHDTLTVAAARQVQYYEQMGRGLEQLHEDLQDVKEILRDRP